MKTETGPQAPFCRHCGIQLEPDSQFCPKCGKAVTMVSTPTPKTQTGPQAPKQIIKGLDNRILIIAIIVVFLVLPIFPRTRIVYVSGTTQTVTNTTSFSTSLEVVTQSTESQMSVYTGSFEYFSSNYYYAYSPYWGGNQWNQCYWYHHHIVCNWSQWNWYSPMYGATVTVSPSDNVVNVITTQQGGLESLILVYANGQQSQTYQNVYVDNLAPNGVSTVPATSVVTNTIVNTVVSPMTLTVPCDQCVPMTVTDHVSILQLLLGF